MVPPDGDAGELFKGMWNEDFAGEPYLFSPGAEASGPSGCAFVRDLEVRILLRDSAPV